MATTPPPPPPPLTPPKSCGNQLRSFSPPPRPGHAAIPFSPNNILPVQETNPPPEAVQDPEGAPASPPPQVQNGPLSPPPEGQEDNPSDSEEKYLPVQETDPAQQMTEQQDEAEQAGEDQLT